MNHEFTSGLERDSERSLYEQITDRLRDYVHQLEVGQQLPTELSLVEMFGVSRSTVRKAVERLVSEGVLVRRAGKGTFVSTPVPKIIHSIDRLAPFVETFKQVGEDISTRIIKFGWDHQCVLPAALSTWTHPVFFFQRLYTSSGVPHAVTEVFLPEHLGKQISQADVEQQPIYSVLAEKLQMTLCQSDYLVSCQPPSQELSDLLNIPRSTFLLVLERITRSKEGQPVEMTRHYLRPDVYQLSVSLDRLHPQ